MIQAVKGADLLASSFIIGATIWFFFIQSPVLLKKLGRERFVPIQMRLTIVLFKTLSAALLLMLGASFWHSSVWSATTLAAAVATAAGLINWIYVVPKALRAGGRSIAEIRGKDSEGSLEGFTSEGVGTKTKTLHRLVVLFVVIMVGGTIYHGLELVVR